MMQTVARLQVLAAALLFSTGGAGLKADAFSAAQMSSLRSGIAAAVLLVWLRRRVRWTPASLAVGLMYAATVTLFVAATKLTTAASAIFLQSSAPLFIILVGPGLLGERFRKQETGYLALVGAGLALCFIGRPDTSGTAPDPETGNLLGALSSATWALTLLGLRYLERDRPDGGGGLSAVVAGNALACAIALPFAWPFPSTSAVNWATVVYLGVFQIGLAYVCLTAAVRRLPALEVSLLLLIEPVLNPLWTWLVHGEDPGAAVIAGGTIIIVATAMRAWFGARASTPVP